MEGWVQRSKSHATRIFVGGLAWETQRDTMRRYFEQFGEILEAVVITDKNTGRSKGYGFVTFKDPEAAMRACQNPSPVIDGRRANCNLASLGAQRIVHQLLNTVHVYICSGRSRLAPGLVAPPAYPGSSSSSYIHQHTEAVYPLNYSGVYRGQQFTPYYTPAAPGTPGMFQNYYPFYPQYAHSSHGFGVHYPSIVQYPYVPESYGSTGILSLPSSTSAASSTAGTTATTATTTETTTTTGVTVAGQGGLQASGAASEQNSST
ncbi:hypothetical protein K2173_025330 [Erythroxylum novogranatense]|uniref:RRM domain-containing protein n=1 Tax=Erythroxylum novogranatense TaxID=1862640 RepID=A0AAV8UG92_9ROSI|nr:hypothetical protein K2173_025330 [Erythroxylum novogranatense]